MSSYSGQTKLTIAGSALRISSALAVNGGVQLRALPTNVGTIYIGNAANTVSSTTGMPLNPGESLNMGWVGDLSELWLNGGTIGDGVAWMVLAI